MSTSVELLDEAGTAVAFALSEVERQERLFAQLPEPSVARIWQESLDQLEGNLSRWQHLLGGAGEQVRQATEELNELDRELRKTISSFAAARKYLQGVD
ncbi:hypothetical protein [Zavarzinella formosa]|uniref:hypothetical protein n=1 Tax=Zavarzinella formosa TaxID=360055 RepID=UPI0002E0100B|nr:hypothetical protein [Zavarzinella formosa]